MHTLIKPPVRSSDRLFVQDQSFCLAVSVEGKRERVLSLRDQVQSDFTSGDVGYKVQRELNSGRDVFVFRGTLDGPVIQVSEAALHVRPAIVAATQTALQTKPASVDARLEVLARKAVTVTLGRLVASAQERLDQARLDLEAEDPEWRGEAELKVVAAHLALDTLVARRGGLTQQAAAVTEEETTPAETAAQMQEVASTPDLSDEDWGGYVDPDLLELTPITDFM